MTTPSRRRRGWNSPSNRASRYGGTNLPRCRCQLAPALSRWAWPLRLIGRPPRVCLKPNTRRSEPSPHRIFKGGAAAELRPGAGIRGSVRHRMRWPVGWSAFEIYPKYAPEAWRPDQAPAWAEIDLLALAVRHSIRESEFNALDSRAAARRDYWRL